MAEVNLSGRMVLNKSNLWNFFKSLNALGRSAVSAFSSLYHFFHYKLSISSEEQNPWNSGTTSRALHWAQIKSVKKDFKDSGIEGGLSSDLPMIK
jgi:hypothetical protein